MQKWQYGHIRWETQHVGGIRGQNNYTLTWVRLTPDGAKEETIVKSVAKPHWDLDKHYREVVWSFIAQLGLEGWESIGNLYPEYSEGEIRAMIFHFKRPIE